MTQNIGIVTRHHAFHVSDRLVTQKVGGKFDAFDDNSNKTVVFRAKDARVVVGYSGRAYLDNIPTDTFIARSLLGVGLRGEGGFYAVGFPPSWTDIGRSVERLSQDLSSALGRLPLSERRSSPLELMILGWRQRP